MEATTPQLTMTQAQINLEAWHQVELVMRRKRKRQHTTDYNALAAAYAKRLPTPLTIVTTLPLDDILGQRTKWHPAAREVAQRIIDWSIQEYKKFPKQWAWVINTISIELNGMFIFTPCFGEINTRIHEQ